MDRDFLQELSSSTRGLIEATPGGLTATPLEEFGWEEVLAEQPEEAVAGLFGEIGRAAAASSALDSVVRHAAPALAQSRASAVCRLMVVPDASLTSGTVVDIRGVLPGWDSVEPEVVVAWHPSADTVAVIDLRESHTEVEDLRGVDPSKRLRAITSSAARVLDICDPSTTAAFQYAVMRANAYEQLGATRAILAIAGEHVRERRQFGQAIGAYQAVQHRLADVFVAAEAAEAGLEASWSSQFDVSVPTAALLAAQTTALAVKHGLQVCGGMGFTDEFSYADQIRRAVLLADLFWSEAELAQIVGARVAAEKTMPRLQSAVYQR